MTAPTIQEFLSRMTAAFQPEKATGIDATIQLRFTGAQAGEFYFVIKDGNCTLMPGLAPAAKLTVTADSGDFTKIFTGELDGMQAFMQGKIRLGGDMNLAMKLLNLFKLK